MHTTQTILDVMLNEEVLREEERLDNRPRETPPRRCCYGDACKVCYYAIKETHTGPC